ncbi:hypothetical protein Pogu_1148 [Pyrobaculum oguniense TE7]|uniref:Uncharacterized protein n=1 Tax=Pyrobaculum oguniense (strain DSM 13380 / JCM 10595 / TE7) TaxID=698757 RepID=H6QA53_PYROT|nr:hypothetical protein Pogu_1148 [Pyrobaculum oguniense TE7]
MSSEGKDIIYQAADTARLLVHLEMAYDVLDEMASNPQRYVDSLQKLSRLAAKVLNDIPKLREALEKESRDRAEAYTGAGVSYKELRDVLDYLERSLSNWALVEKRLITYLESLSKDDLAREVKKFAALAIAPDRYTLMLKRWLEL